MFVFFFVILVVGGAAFDIVPSRSMKQCGIVGFAKRSNVCTRSCNSTASRLFILMFIFLQRIYRYIYTAFTS